MICLAKKFSDNWNLFKQQSLSDQQNIFKTHLNHKKTKPTKRQKDYEKPVKRKIKIKQIMRIVYRFINRYMCNFNK